MIGTVLPSPRTRKAASILILLKGNSHWKGNMPNIRSSITVSWNPFGDHPCESLQGRGLVNLLWPYHQIDEVPYLVYSNLRWVCFTTRSWIVNFAFGNEHRITSTIRAQPHVRVYRCFIHPWLASLYLQCSQYRKVLKCENHLSDCDASILWQLD